MKSLALALSLLVFSGAQTTAAAPDTEPKIADKGSYLAEVSRLCQVDWPKNRTVNIVCHGHSVPAGYVETPEIRQGDAYPRLLHEGLNERFTHAVINVIVTAIGGEKSDTGAERFERDVLSHRPDVVTIDYGLNDRYLGLEQARKAWESMIEQALAKNIKVILLTPSPDVRVNKKVNLADPNDPLRQHAAQIRDLAKKYHVGLVDSLAEFDRAAGEKRDYAPFMASVNHPSRKGHELITKSLLEWFPTKVEGTKP